MIRILLIGFMGAGKTTLGRALANKLGVMFIDMDNYIENRFHKTIKELFTERGEQGFRTLERNILYEVAEFEDVIIATGGGVPCWFDNMGYMNSQGKTVFLDASLETLFTRLTISHSQRPLLDGKSNEELRSYLKATLKERLPYYSKAQYTFCSDELEDKKQIDRSVERFIKEIFHE